MSAAKKRAPKRRSKAKQQPHPWLASGAFLPPFLRDFHNQKDLFKWLFWNIAEVRKKDPRKVRDLESMNWVAAHIFTIDWFLWLMAKHGYTLQRSRAPVDFDDIDAKIASFQSMQTAAFELRDARAEARSGRPV